MREQNWILALQYHLYEHPLYQFVEPSASYLNVMVFGFGYNGQKFLDICLQVGQMPQKKLQLTVITKSNQDVENYLEKRPALGEFFEIIRDGKPASEIMDSYGSIRFVTKELSTADEQTNFTLMQDLMIQDESEEEQNRLDYVFVALGDDRLNQSAAKACREAADTLECFCAVSYVCSDKQAEKETIANTTVVYVNEDVTQNPVHSDIERMAFNTHLVWEPNLNIDFEKVKSDYYDPYNHDACVANVLSLKYKLHSVGIELDDIGFEEAARAFEAQKLDTDATDNQTKNELIWMEHRRWVAEKLCLGYSPMTDLSGCANGITKDTSKKQHICIIRSNPNQKLAQKTKDEGIAIWDTMSEAAINRLDPLDQLSIRVHRVCKQKAEELKTLGLMDGDTICAIRDLARSEKSVFVAFQEWYSCLQEIYGNIEGDVVGKVYSYKSLRDALVKKAECMKPEIKKSFLEQLEGFEALFGPVRLAKEYRDWKKSDTDLIDNIPFVLTYSEQIQLMIPFATDEEDNSQLFGFITAPTVVNPEKVVYLCYLKDEKSVSTAKNTMQETLPEIISYMDKKRVRSRMQFVFFFVKEYEESVRKLVKLLEDMKIDRMDESEYVAMEKKSDFSNAFNDLLQQRIEQGKDVFLEKNETKLSESMDLLGCFDPYPSYQYDKHKMRFVEDTSMRPSLHYIRKKPLITVADVFAFKLASSDSCNQPEFYMDYDELWNRYRSSTDAWKKMCTDLADYDKNHSLLAKFEKGVAGGVQQYVYIVPAICSASVIKIVKYLKKHGYIENSSKVLAYATDSYQVTISDRYQNKEKFDELFTKMYELIDVDSVLPMENGNGMILWDRFSVEEMELVNGRFNQIKTLLNYFHNKGYILSYEVKQVGTKTLVSFLYGSKAIKRLLSNAGNMLEVYTFHKLKQVNQFDDVVSSYEIAWNDSGIKNEFDCIVTKGMKMLFVECKARTKLDQNFYYKLAELNKRFGINAKAVLVADTREDLSDRNTEENDINRERGDLLVDEVITISDVNEIDDIGNTLLRVIEQD